MRRVALREHSSCVHAWRYGKSMPLVSILLASKRPDFLQWAIANVVKQTYPRVELIVALHGDGFMDAEQCIASLPHPTRVLRIPASEPLGTVLDAATAASSGSLLTKMDDDDVYGADHLWDLVLAHEYSQAPLVGKWLEFVYLAESNLTVRWFSGYGDRYQTSGPAGGTMLLSRCDLARYGGWPAVASGVDTALANNILRAGGVVYRTHAAGFMLVRHGGGHTWHDRRTTDRAFVAEADCVWSGFHPGRAGIEPSTTPHPAIDQPQ